MPFLNQKEKVYFKNEVPSLFNRAINPKTRP
jgi:hypothetical protein